MGGKEPFAAVVNYLARFIQSYKSTNEGKKSQSMTFPDFVSAAKGLARPDARRGCSADEHLRYSLLSWTTANPMTFT